MKFSQRVGATPTNKAIQLKNIDDDLRNGLWNVLKVEILDEIETGSGAFLTTAQDTVKFHLWHNVFKLPLDTAPNHSRDFNLVIREIFFKAEWHLVYDILEETYRQMIISNELGDIIDIEYKFNEVLQREFAGYRFIEGYLVAITNEGEIKELMEASSNTGALSLLKGCNIHLETALQKLSDRKNPDYRNSIKESISAVESLAKIISQRSNDTLGASLDRIKGKINLHPSLERGFKQIYGYTSDEGGIRHALMDSPNCDFEDAKFMLISCSAFINYLIVKANKASISFE